MADEWVDVKAEDAGWTPVQPPTEAPRAAPEAYAGWDVPGAPKFIMQSGKPVSLEAPTKPKPEKPKTWDEAHPMVRFTNKLPEPIATVAGIGAWLLPDMAQSIYKGAGDLAGRLRGPPQIQGLNPDEFGAFSTLMTLGAGDLPGSAITAAGRTVSDKATRAVTKRVAQDMKATGSTPVEVAEELGAGRAMGKPLMLADVGENTQGLLGAVARKPGEAKQAVKETMTARDEGAYPRSQADIEHGLGSSPTTKQTHMGIKQNQQIISQPLYDAAYEGGSIAPLEHQFTQAFDKASSASKSASEALNHARMKLTQAEAKMTQTGGNVYSENAARQELREAESMVTRAQRNFESAEGQKRQVLDVLRQTQEDASLNRPGAVWTPYIQEVLEDPIVRSGISRGLESQRLEGLAKRTKIDPTEYTIVGVDEAGSPIVSKTPNMRTLDAVKRGMDHIIASERQADGSLTQRGREIYLVREQFLKDVDGVNPKYAEARSTWAGEAAADDALNTGKNFDKFANPDDLHDVVKGMSEPEKEFMRIGVANRLREKIGNLSVNGDEAKALLNTPFMKERLRAVFPSTQAATEFIERVNLERRMFETKLGTLGNSATAKRLSEDVSHELEAGANFAHAAGNMAAGHYLTGLRSAWRGMMHMGKRTDPVLNARIAEVLMDPTAIPAMGAETTRLPPHTVGGRMLGRANTRPGRMTIQRGQTTLNQLGGPP